jgi:hypothetical protein
VNPIGYSGPPWVKLPGNKKVIIKLRGYTPDVGEIRQPLQVRGDGAKRDEEPAEQ